VTGRVVGAGEFPASGSRHITTPWRHGSVLVLDDAARGFPQLGPAAN
jgi:hypothetical protein